MKDDLIEIKCIVEGIRFYKNSWGIVEVSIDEVIKGKPQTDKDGLLILKGEMPKVQVGGQYVVNAEYVEDPKWGGQYNIIKMYSDIDFNNCDGQMKKKFLATLFNESQLQSLYDALDDPFEALQNRDFSQLVKVKGVGMFRAVEYANRFSANIALSRIYIELSDYNLTKKMIQKLMDRYESPDLVIEKVKDNPYVLAVEVNGIGWLTADKMALAGGITEDDPRRIGAFIHHYLYIKGEEGCSWITTDELLGAILDNLGEELSDESISNGLRNVMDKLWFNEEKTKIGLQYYYYIEKRIAEELIRIRDAEPDIKMKDWQNWQDVIARLENEQGWNYTEEQLEGIKLALESNITLITGMAGSGKSTLVRAILAILNDKSYVQCALSGRAASRLSEITGQEGYTIHRLLGYPCHKPENKQGYEFHDDNPLPYEIYILDEVSMVNSSLFYYLLRAIPSGSKLVCLGDHGQLEAIGSGNVAHDMMKSPEIPTVVLTKIQRQAEESGIISEAFKVRKGIFITEKDWVGTERRGKLQDLKLVTYSDASNTFYKVTAEYSALMNQPDFNLLQTQIIVPVKTRGNASTIGLNNSIQELINPPDKRRREITTFTSGKATILREGDKVINVRNNYKTKPPIYNGNMGILREIKIDNEDDNKSYIIVDFVEFGAVKIPKDYWEDLELGYAITVHKAQGSEWDHVIIGIDVNSSVLLTRELLYTAMTRAKKDCVLVAQSGALGHAIANESIEKKATHLQQLLHDIAHPKIVF